MSDVTITIACDNAAFGDDYNNQGTEVARILRKLADKLDDRRLAVRGLGRGGRAVIANEAHALRADGVKALLIPLDVGNIPTHAVWVFTTTFAGEQTLFDRHEDANPLLSRCTVIHLRVDSKNELDFALAARKVAQAENLDGRPIGEYCAMARACKGNLRMMLSRIEAGAMLAGGAQ